MFVRVQQLMASAKDKNTNKDLIASNMGATITEFNDLCKKTWKRLMGLELVLFEQMEVQI